MAVVQGDLIFLDECCKFKVYIQYRFILKLSIQAQLKKIFSQLSSSGGQVDRVVIISAYKSVSRGSNPVPGKN